MPSSSEPDIAYLVGTTTLLGTDLSEAVATPGPTGAYVVNLTFSNEGAQKFADLTAQAASFPSGDARRQIAIVLDGAVISAPPVAFDVSPSTGIAGGQAVVTLGSGPDSRQEAEDLAIVLRYGALPVELERMSLQQVSATLGQDALRAGIVAGTVGVILVAILVITIYRALGVIAIGGLLIFGAFILLSFILLGEWMGVTLTLAGVTGMIVSVGMNADSYIIYFERTKELVREGATPSAAAAGAFKSAYRTILTATFVSFMGAFLLWLLAIGPVKGFAFSLGIATIIGVIVVRWYAVPAVAMLAESRLGTSGFLSIPAVSGAVAEEVTT